MSRGLRAATALVGLALVVLGGLGTLTSRLDGSTGRGPLPPMAVGVAGIGLLLLGLAARGRAPGWLPARRPALLPQLLLTIALVLLVSVGSAVAAVRPDGVGRIALAGSLALALLLVVLAVLRGWVPRIGGRRDR